MIPHRYPMLLVDRVEEITPGASAIGIKNITINEPQFQGHFPQQAVMPGVLIVEAMAQTAGIFVVNSLGKKSEGSLVYFMSVDKARFRKPITPGDQIKIEVVKEKSRGDIWQFYGKSFVKDDLACESSFAAMVVRLDGDNNE